MPVALLILFFLIPITVAMSADLGHFALFIVLACVMAGLKTSKSEAPPLALTSDHGAVHANKRTMASGSCA